jgi:hypothetical protein
MEDVEEVRGEVIRVVRGGFEDHGPDGAVRLDQSVVRVIEPAALAGRTLSIVIDADDASDVLGSEGPVAFVIALEDLDLDVIFTGALTELRRLSRGSE